MVVDVAESVFDPQNVENLADPDSYHWEVSGIAEDHDPFVVFEGSWNPISDLVDG